MLWRPQRPKFKIPGSTDEIRLDRRALLPQLGILAFLAYGAGVSTVPEVVDSPVSSQEADLDIARINSYNEGYAAAARVEAKLGAIAGQQAVSLANLLNGSGGKYSVSAKLLNGSAVMKTSYDNVGLGHFTYPIVVGDFSNSDTGLGNKYFLTQILPSAGPDDPVEFELARAGVNIEQLDVEDPNNPLVDALLYTDVRGNDNHQGRVIWAAIDGQPLGVMPATVQFPATK